MVIIFKSVLSSVSELASFSQEMDVLFLLFEGNATANTKTTSTL